MAPLKSQIQEDKKHLWLVDSGCSDHLSPFKSDFVSRGDQMRHCMTANGNLMHIYGPGTIIMKHFNGEETITLTLTGVWYAPHMGNRLISVTALTRQGFHCEITDKTCFWDNTGRLVITASMRNRLDKLHLFKADAIRPSSQCDTLQKEDSYIIWHMRFGHCSHNALKHAATHLDGIPSLIVPSDWSPCKGCLLGKASQTPFPPSASRGSHPLELVHTDLCEFPTRSRNHNHWMMTFLDDYSGFGSIVFLKKNSEASTKFTDWLAWAERHCGQKLLKLRSDRGGGNTFPLIYKIS